MDELQKTLYAHWILDECNDPVDEIEWLVNCILDNNKKLFIEDTQSVLKHLEQKIKDDERISSNNQ